MANPEHVKVVKQGADAIRVWRKTHLNKRLDLRKADLSDADLREADLSDADLSKANLREVNLNKANLREVNLNEANLREVNLNEANLIGADLSDADLSKADLRGADLREAKLREVNLSDASLTMAKLSSVNLNEANLSDADLRGANLNEANLSDADLRGANLIEADLSDADLRGANLNEANLSDADLSRAKLRGADLIGCNCGFAVFGRVDLSEVVGLESVEHRGPSTIGVDTLTMSKGRIPKGFLKGCGLSDWEIEAAKLYDRNLSPSQIIDIHQQVFNIRTGSAIQIGSLFISYSHGDSAFVDAIEEKLNDKGIRFWRDIHDAPAGPLDAIVDRAMRLNPTVLLVLSKASVESDWVENEATRARELEKELGRHVLCPIAIDDTWKDCKWSSKLRTQIEKYNILRFEEWEDPDTFERRFRKLVEGLSIFYKPEEGSP